MKTIKVNNIYFKGQYADALELLQNGEDITMANFNNGKWEPTSKVARFLNLLKLAKINYLIEGQSLRKMIIRGGK